jgi:tryptophan synthase alpha chain
VSRIQQSFQNNKARGVRGLLPYFTAGFPSLAATGALIRCADELGATVVEIGEPYSDSIADGPVIQESFNSALAKGHRVGDTFEMVAEIRPQISCPLVIMVSYSVVHRIGLERFVGEAAVAGLDGLIFPDVPVEESAPAAQSARAAGLDCIGLVAPTTSAARRESIARSSSGFIYQIALVGTTGERAEAPRQVTESVTALRAACDLPICLGFGISTAAQVRAVCAFADGAIVGSAIVRRIAEAVRNDASTENVVDAARSFLQELMSGCS